MFPTYKKINTIIFFLNLIKNIFKNFNLVQILITYAINNVL